MAGGTRLELLGGARVFRDGAPVSGLGKKALALIAYLAASPGKLNHRDHLADLLWPDRFDEQARQSLRQTLTSLRKALGEETLTTEEGGVALPAGQASTDAGEFAVLAAARDTDSLQRATTLYHGDFLETLGSVSSVFDEWADTERRRLRNLFFDALESLARKELEGGRFEEALAHAQRLLALDPANEQACRTSMQALFALGRRSAALRQFETCKAALARTLDAKPAPETLALAERIQTAAETAPDRAPSDAHSTADASHARPPARGPGWLRRPIDDFRRLPPRAKFAVALASLAALAGLGAFALRDWGRAFSNSTSPPAAALASQASGCARAIGLRQAAAPSIAVTPWRSSGGTRAAEFAQATTARIGDLLGAVPALTVKSSPSGEELRRLSATRLAAQLGVSHVLEGDVRADGDRLEVGMRLIDGKTGAVLQSRARSYEWADRRAARDALAIDAAEAVQVNLTEGEQALSYYMYPTRSMDVFGRLTSAARHFDQMSRAHNARARQDYAAARALDPRDPRAISGLAWTYLIDVYAGWSANPGADLSRAKALAREAIRADRSGAFFYPYTLLSVAALMEGDHANALAHGETAVRVSDGAADALAVLSLVLSYQGDHPRSAETAKMAMRRRPLTYPIWYEWVLGRAARLNGETDLALACLPIERVRDSRFALPMMERAAALGEVGQSGRARQEMTSFSVRNAGALTAESYCARPSYANAALTQRCITDMRRAGLR